MYRETFRSVMSRGYNDKNFEDRVTIQKIVYLAECAGLNLGNNMFSWHKRGPYSIFLRQDIKDEIAQGDEDKEGGWASFGDDVIKNLEVIAQKAPKPFWLEMIASFHYLACYEMPRKELKDIFTELQKRKSELLRKNDVDLGCPKTQKEVLKTWKDYCQNTGISWFVPDFA